MVGIKSMPESTEVRDGGGGAWSMLGMFTKKWSGGDLVTERAWVQELVWRESRGGVG